MTVFILVIIISTIIIIITVTIIIIIIIMSIDLVRFPDTKTGKRRFSFDLNLLSNQSKSFLPLV